MAIEASPAVAVARALPTTHPSGRFAPGWVTVRIVPQSTDPRPMPSFGLRQRVQRFIASRRPVGDCHPDRGHWHRCTCPSEWRPCSARSMPTAAADRDRSPCARRCCAFCIRSTGGPEAPRLALRPRCVPVGRRGLARETCLAWTTSRRCRCSPMARHVGERVAVPAERMVVAGELRSHAVRRGRLTSCPSRCPTSTRGAGPTSSTKVARSSRATRRRWTDHNVHDPGITLIELFAWLIEQLIYRANRIPDRHLRKFLALAGRPRRTASSRRPCSRSRSRQVQSQQRAGGVLCWP